MPKEVLVQIQDDEQKAWNEFMTTGDTEKLKDVMKYVEERFELLGINNSDEIVDEIAETTTVKK